MREEDNEIGKPEKKVEQETEQRTMSTEETERLIRVEGDESGGASREEKRGEVELRRTDTERNEGQERAADIDDILEEIGTTRLQWKCAMILGLCNAADAVEVLAIGYIITVFKDPVTGKRIDEMAGWSSLLTSSVFVGMLLGGLVSGSLGDKFGRKPTLSVSLILNSGSAFISSMTPFLPNVLQVPWLILFRFIGGLGVGGSVPSAFALGSELGPTSTRSLFINIIACFWSVGVLYTSLTAFVFLHGEGNDGNWPYFTAFVALPGFSAGILCLTTLEESPRWSWMNGKSRMTRATLHRFLESSPSRFPSEVIQNMKDKIDTILDDTDCSNANQTEQENDLIVHNLSCVEWICRGAASFCAGGELRQRMVYLCGIFSFLSFAHYGISSWISDLFRKVHFDDPYVTSIFYTFATVPGLAAAIFFVDRYGRRVMTAWSMVIASLSALLFAFNTSKRTFIIIAAILFNGSSACAWNSLDIFSAELLPAKIRGTGLGIAAASGRVGSVLANVFNSFVLASGGSDEGAVAIVLTCAGISMLLGAFCAWRLPETMGVSHLG